MSWLFAGLAVAGEVVEVAATDEPSPAHSSLSQRVDFDLPAQRLASALRQFGAVSGRSVMFIDDWVAGLQSAPVRGRYSPRDALRRLLAGTGLDADDVDADGSGAFVLKRETAAAPGAPLRPDRLRRYDALVQARVWEALCADPLGVPGDYRAILRLRVTPAGRIRQASLVSSTGFAARDAAVLAAVDDLQLDLAPPPDLEQPLMLAILPRDVLAGPGCGAVH